MVENRLHLLNILLKPLKYADLFILSTGSSMKAIWATVCYCFYSSWGGGLKWPGCRRSLRRDGAWKPISLWQQAAAFEWSALKYCMSSLWFLLCKCGVGKHAYMACVCNSLIWYISGIKQQRSDKENRRDWSHRRYEEPCQAGYKLFLRWVI